MKSHLQLLTLILQDMGNRCCVSTSRDLETITARYNNEGLSFLGITLPSFAQGLQKALDVGKVSSSDFPAFGMSGGLPKFLSGFLSLIFDRKSGRLVQFPSTDSIQAVLQICLLNSKIETPCSAKRERRSIEGYLDCEKRIRDLDTILSPNYWRLNNVIDLCLGGVLARVNRDVYYGELTPKHGPGATSDKLFGNAKFADRKWTRRLEEVFPSWEYLHPGPRFSCEESYDLLEPGAEIPVRVISVPKTMKTVRIIGVEPTSVQYAQQALLRSFVSAFEKDDIFSKFVNLEDASLNRECARIGSLDGSLATLDLSMASDSVSNQLVRHIVRRHTALLGALDATRSRKADVPGHGVIRLAKFSSMGSAVCFPVECMVFLCLAFYGIELQLNRPLTRKDILSFSGRVRVFGDDIIVPKEFARSVAISLQTFGFSVNTDKSFWTGMFRESCGGVYYSGDDVSVVYQRKFLPSHRRHVREIVSCVSLRNQLYFAGYWGCARALDQLLRRLIPFPTVEPTSPCLGRHSFISRFEIQGWSKTLHVPLVRGSVLSYRIPQSLIDGPDALLKCFLNDGDSPFPDKKHLERAGRPRTVGIKTRWVPPY